MSKTKEELNALKEEVETLNKKLAELTEEEIKQVSGGTGPQLVKPRETLSLPKTISGLDIS